MKKRYFFSLLLLLCLVADHQIRAQENSPPFWQEIQDFKKQDSIQAPPKDAILFVGSSSFRMWNNVQEMFPKHTILNRGFGGSNLLDLQYYLGYIVFPYQPKQIIIYSGENDIAAGDVSASDVLERFDTVFQSIRAQLPKVPIVFVSIKPSPSREQYMPIMEESNTLIRNYLKKEPKTKFVDVYSLMLEKDGKPKSDIFLEDNLHMNQKGYAIWQKALQLHLKK